MGGHSSKAPSGYQPAFQAQADQSYQNLVSGMQPYASGIASTTIPGLTSVAQNVQNNPYYGTAQQGANDVYGLSQNLYPQQYAGAMNMNQLGATAGANALPMAQAAANYGQLAYGQSQALIPQATGGYGLAGGQYAGAMNMIPGNTQSWMANPLMASSVARGQGISDAALSAIPGLTGGMDAANQILQTGFDPQQALYDRESQKSFDKTNAINAMYGVASSPYGAGLASDASRNFDIDWQNAQLQRQIQALGAYGQQQGVVSSNLNNLLNTGSSTYNYGVNTGVGAYTGLTSNAANNYANLAGAATGNYNALTNGATQNYLGLAGFGQNAVQQGLTNAANLYGSLTGTAGQAYGQGSQLGVDAMQSLAQGAAAPSNAYLSQQQSWMQALQALASGGTQALAPSQQLVQDQGAYLGIGQNATKNAIDAANTNAHARDAMWGALGQAAGTAAAFLI